MDPHFNEYLAAVAGMREIYGEAGDEMPTEFQQVEATKVAEAVA
jgi:hypothetical protein